MQLNYMRALSNIMRVLSIQYRRTQTSEQFYITLPKDVVERWNLSKKDAIAFIDKGDFAIIMPAERISEKFEVIVR